MSKIILVTGGGRSGKSHYAQERGLSLAPRRAYIATCPANIDSEMNERILLHKKERQVEDWQTFEEEVRVFETIRELSHFNVIVVDCLTLWLNNLLYRAGDMSEKDVVRECQKITEMSDMATSAIIFVSNEVGMGIVPAQKETRQFRDLMGRCNQVVASLADEVVLMVSGIPVTVKG